MSSVRPSNSGCTRIVGRARRWRKRCSSHSREHLQLPKCSPNYPRASRIGWTHARHCPLLLQHSKTFFTLKSRFFCTYQIANSARALARVVFTAKTFRYTCTCTCTCCFQRQHFRFVDLSTLPMFLQPFQTRFLNLQSHRETLTQMLVNTSQQKQLKLSFTRKTFAGKKFHRQ